jgi:hypothetical protein
MKTAIGLQFLNCGRRIARVAGWVVVTMAFGFLLTIVFGRPVTSSTSFAPTPPGSHQIIKSKTGPWVYRSVSVPV